jgi:hypothetical protein
MQAFCIEIFLEFSDMNRNPNPCAACSSDIFRSAEVPVKSRAAKLTDATRPHRSVAHSRMARASLVASPVDIALSMRLKYAVFANSLEARSGS